MPKRLGVLRDAYVRPLIDGLHSGRTNTEPIFEVLESPTQGTEGLVNWLRQRTVDGAFLSPIDYAREYTNYWILPHAGVVSRAPSGIIELVFNQQIHDIRKIAVRSGITSEAVLVQLVLKEKYGSVPDVVRTDAPVESALEQTDAILLVGDEALRREELSNKIDIVDEWIDITELPYVHGFWVTRENFLASSDVRRLTANFAGQKAWTSPPSVDGRVPVMAYAMDENAVDGLTEFIRLAYYHGLLNDIPDLRFLRDGGTTVQEFHTRN